MLVVITTYSLYTVLDLTPYLSGNNSINRALGFLEAAQCQLYFIFIYLEPLLLYECTTEMGSSGSPVLKEVDGDLKIVALHRGGKDKQWNSDGYNCGTLIQQIVNHLNGQQCLRCKSTICYSIYNYLIQ